MTTPEQTPKPKGPRRISAREIFAIVLAVLGLVFALENTRRVKVRFIIPQVTTHVWVALLASLVIGGVRLAAAPVVGASRPVRPVSWWPASLRGHRGGFA